MQTDPYLRKKTVCCQITELFTCHLQLVNMDVRTWSKNFTVDFIAVYKSHPCLWKIKSLDYRNRNLRDQAYIQMIQFCKTKGINDANRDFVAKKIQSLRGSYRKELKKQNDSQRSGRGTEEIYAPSLWYFDLLSFTKDQEIPTDSMSNMNDFETQSVIGENENYEEEQSITPRVEQELEHSYVRTTPKPTPKRKRNSQAEFFDICSATLKLNNQPLTDFDGVGLYVSKKLAKMEPLQVVYAESLIYSIIRRGMLNNLKEETDFNDCKASPSMLISSPSSPQNVMPVHNISLEDDSDE